MTLKVRKIIKFEFENGHDIEFCPDPQDATIFEVWCNGLHVENLLKGERPTEARAIYYYELAHATSESSRRPSTRSQRVH
jgi:hypothetical protein